MKTLLILEFAENRIGFPQKLRHIKIGREGAKIILPSWESWII